MKKILISGASIAGPALAFWLSRRGCAVTVVERAAALRPGGYAIDVRGAALDVAARMGLLPAMRAGGTDTLSTQFIDARGRRLATFARGFGVISPEDVEILRGDLALLLYEATRHDVRYLFDDSITALAQDNGGVQVAFAQRAGERFDYVIGADGLHSNVRALAFGPEESFVRHLGSAIAIFSAGNHSGLDRAQLMLMAPRRVASIKSDRGNGTVKATLLFAASSVPDRRDVALQRRMVHEAFADLGGPIAALLAELPSAPDFYFDAVCQARVPSWRQGRVLLVGDAAYGPSPLTGQGTSLALIGAYELARALSGDDEPAAVGARYESRLRPFVTRNQDVALGTAKNFAPMSTFGAWFRNANLRILPHLPWRDFVLAMMMRDIERAAKAHTLADEAAPAADYERKAVSYGGRSLR